METKIYFKDLSMNEKTNLITVWKNLSITEYSTHAREKMDTLDITEEMIELAWKINHIIEYKVKDGRPRMVVRGIHNHLCNSDFMNHGTNRVALSKKLQCNICLVVDMLTGKLITCYASPTATARLYKNNNTDYEKNMNDTLEQNLKVVLEKLYVENRE